MIKVQHGVELAFILNEAHFFSIRLKLFHIHVIDIFSYQSFNDLFEVEPPKEQSNKITTLTRLTVVWEGNEMKRAHGRL